MSNEYRQIRFSPGVKVFFFLMFMMFVGTSTLLVNEFTGGDLLEFDFDRSVQTHGLSNEEIANRISQALSIHQSLCWYQISFMDENKPGRWWNKIELEAYKECSSLYR